ncbi:MAG: D-alanyl-D-alanine carboxypeptidase/D-alanyl-D-alanine-endopeptidase [Timaviella obliquedivisa GSE-PSE-MK23-08B]|jgi:D-alanyl-D-alanine carboxypeptidase/D-alanyl-D-alanine-endopeptidase (penicillin-binding protein 4)|nr:D-alanyl-D-alanine carboxypeptidase/D-alanyl-D-alanine-endopeptidase [Timaviella obliquedivisa GSE-PSE-MK23-08B]
MTQNRLFLWLLSLTTLIVTLWLKPAAAQTGICSAQLPDKISAVTNRPEFRRSRWGILVQTLGDPCGICEAARETLYAQDADRFFIPASNLKLLTTAAALEVLGDRYTIRTSVYQVHSDQVILRVVGRGDPSLTDIQLNQLAKQIRDRNITQIDQLIADDSYFQGDATNPTWEWEDVQSGYGAPVNSLILNENLIGLTFFPQNLGQPLRIVWDDPAEATRWQISNRSKTVAAAAEESLQVGRDLERSQLNVRGQLRVGSRPETAAIAITQPSRYFLQRFKQALRQWNIQVNQSFVTTERTGAQGTEISAVESESLPGLIAKVNQESNNLYAESLLRTLGITRSPQASSSLEAGVEAVKKALTQLGVDVAGYNLRDGSGVSRHNWATPESLVQTLQGMGASPHAVPYRNSLAVAGRVGSLQNRFLNSPVAGKLQGKTGFLSGSTALSGYLEPPDYSPLVFSILINQFDRPVEEIQEAIDEIVELLAQLQKC